MINMQVCAIKFRMALDKVPSGTSELMHGTWVSLQWSWRKPRLAVLPVCLSSPGNHFLHHWVKEK